MRGLTRNLRQVLTPATSYAILAILALVAGCQSLGLPTPQGFNEKLAASYSAVTSVRDTTLALLTAGQITKDEAKQVQARADEARAGLDAASTLKGSDFGAAETRLATATQLLTTLQKFLADRRSGVTTGAPP